MLSPGQLIWASCRPLIRLAICAGGGFGITKADIFPPVAARGAGQILLNIALPCLMFSKIVPAFNAENVKALGPLVLVAVVYELMGIVMAWAIKQICWVPHRFRYGVLVAGGWGNYGDIPTSVIMSITGAAPFNGTVDQTLSVAYISAFILVFYMTLFPLGGHKLIAMDFVGPEVENDEVREMARMKRHDLLSGDWIRPIMNGLRFRGKSIRPAESLEQSCGKSTSATNADIEKGNYEYPSEPRPDIRTNVDHHRHVSFCVDDATTETAVVSPPISNYAGPSRIASPTPSILPSEKPSTVTVQPIADPPVTITALSRPQKVFRFAINFLRSLLAPGSSSIIISLIISLIPTLKALFVPNVPNTHIPPAPDGLPPLNFVLDAATFIGAASVPLGLICLGSALARLKIPKGQWGDLPMGAIGGLAVGRVLVMPVLGVLLCEGLTNVGVINRDDKVLRFVCMFFSCLPTATTQVFLTQVYSGTGSAEHLSAFLIPQYILMFISMTALTAYSLQYLF